MIAVIFFLLILNLGISNAQNCSQLFNKEMLRLHNLDRGKHKAPALSLDISLTNFATSYTSKLASRNGGLVHSQARGQGENLAALFGNANPDKCTGNLHLNFDLINFILFNKFIVLNRQKWLSKCI